jgi:hypothetical protein
MAAQPAVALLSWRAVAPSEGLTEAHYYVVFQRFAGAEPASDAVERRSTVDSGRSSLGLAAVQGKRALMAPPAGSQRTQKVAEALMPLVERVARGRELAVRPSIL